MKLRPSSPREMAFLASSAGVVSGIIFYILTAGSQASIFFIFLPSLPLLLTGLSFGIKYASVACAAAIIIAGLLTGYDRAFFFAFLLALPCLYFNYRALHWRALNGGREWYPILKLLAELAVIFAVILMLLALATGRQGGLQSFIPPHFADMALSNNFKNADADFAVTMRQLFGDLSFILFALFANLWILLLYASATLANRILKAQTFNLRPSLAIEPRGLPEWLLILVILTILWMTLGHGNDRYTAEIVLLILQFPYIFSGMAYIHEFSIRQHVFMRKLWLSCFYLILVCLRWPLIFIVALGLWIQLAEILDRHRKIR